MSKAYVVINEQGSYSDYSMCLMFVSRTEAGAEAKMAELKVLAEHRDKAHEEFSKAEKAIQAEYPDPPGRPTGGLGADYPRYQAALSDWFRDCYTSVATKRNELTAAKAKEISLRYGLEDAETATWVHSHYGDYSIQEVESD